MRAQLIDAMDVNDGEVKVTVLNIFGNLVTRSFSMTRKEFMETYHRWYDDGLNIQDAFPVLSASEREHLLTGLTDDEWNEMIPNA